MYSKKAGLEWLEMCSKTSIFRGRNRIQMDSNSKKGDMWSVSTSKINIMCFYSEMMAWVLTETWRVIFNNWVHQIQSDSIIISPFCWVEYIHVKWSKKCAQQESAQRHAHTKWSGNLCSVDVVEQTNTGKYWFVLVEKSWNIHYHMLWLIHYTDCKFKIYIRYIYPSWSWVMGSMFLFHSISSFPAR